MLAFGGAIDTFPVRMRPMKSARIDAIIVGMPIDRNKRLFYHASTPTRGGAARLLSVEPP
jgi:hypothetical protein